jgi:hypothetical protein
VCGVELKKEAEGFPDFLALFNDITRYDAGNRNNRLTAAKDLWTRFSGQKLMMKSLSVELRDKIGRISKGHPEELCPCGRSLMSKRPFGKVCSEACHERTCSTCLGPKVVVLDRYTDAQMARFAEATALAQEADMIESRKRIEPYLKRRRELQVYSAMDLYAEDKGLCCRAYFIHGRNPDGTPWCDRCSPSFRWFRAAVNYEPADGNLSQPPQELRNRADTIRSSIVRPTRMVCKPCAEKRDGYDHYLVQRELAEHEFEERAAKRRRVD